MLLNERRWIEACSETRFTSKPPQTRDERLGVVEEGVEASQLLLHNIWINSYVCVMVDGQM